MERARSDADVIALSLHDPEAFGTLFDRHFLAVYRLCARRTDLARSEDLAIEAFRRAFEHRARYDLARPDARPWLFTIAMNLVRDSLRSSASQQRAYERLKSFAEATEKDHDDGVISALDARRRLALVTASLQLMPVDEVEVLLLYAWDNLSYSEMAEVLAVPIGTVRSRLNRIRQRLHLALGERPPLQAQHSPGVSL